MTLATGRERVGGSGARQGLTFTFRRVGEDARALLHGAPRQDTACACVFLEPFRQFQARELIKLWIHLQASWLSDCRHDDDKLALLVLERAYT